MRIRKKHKQIIKSIYIALFGFLFCFNGLSQDGYLELGGGINLSHYSGDLTPPEFSKVLINTSPGAYAVARFNPDARINVKLLLSYAQLQESDVRSSKDWQKQRNLSFHTHLFEFAFMGEVNILEYHAINSYNPFTIYLTGGLGGFYFNPRAQFEGQWYALQPLGTEGQGLEAYPDKDFYSRFELAIPMGGGIKYRLSDRINLNIEVALRYTLTDYIDDISTDYADYSILLEQRGRAAADLSHGLVEKGSGLNYEINPGESRRGGPTVNDYYSLINIGLTYDLYDLNMSPARGNKPRKRRGRLKCPKF